MDTIEPQVEVKPCIKCGARDRYKGGGGGCRPCAQERQRRYHEANRDKVLEGQRRYYEANRDKLLKSLRRYHESNRDEVLERRRSYYESNRDKIREQSRRWREANRDKVRERERRYRQANRDKVRERKRCYREANQDKMREQSRRRREVNRDKMRERDRSYYEANQDKFREKNRRWREVNQDKIREQSRRYHKANPDVSLRAKHNRRARKSNPNYPDDKLSRGLKKKLMKLQGGKCAYANAPLARWCAIDIRKENHMDHIVPLAPPHNGRNIDSNMQLTCPACNLRKSSKHPTDFAREVGMIL